MRRMAVILVMLLALSAAVAPQLLPRHAGPQGSSPSASPMASPAISTDYRATIYAQGNSSMSTLEASSSATWPSETSQKVLLSGSPHTWNGTVNFRLRSEIQFQNPVQQTIEETANGPAYVQTYGVGTVTADLIIGSTTYSWSVSIDGLSFHLSNTSVAPEWTVQAPSSAPMYLQLSVTQFDGQIVGNPAYLLTVAEPSGGSNLFDCGPLGSASSVDALWGWNYANAPFSAAYFTVPSLATGTVISFSSPLVLNASYDGTVTRSVGTGSFDYVSGVESISFQPAVNNGPDPLLVDYALSYSSAAIPAVTEEYYVGGVQSSATYFATTTYPYNATYDYIVFNVPSPSNRSTNLTLVGSSAWSFISASPAGYSFFASNSTVLFPSVPQEAQAVWVAPAPYISTQMHIVLSPTSSLFDIFGVNIPFSLLDVFVNGIQVYSPDVPAVVSLTYNITIQDVFRQVLYSQNVTMSEPNQVVNAQLPIWPLTFDNANSSFIMRTTVGFGGIFQVAPDIAPLQSNIFYFPQGDYNFSIDYLNETNGAIYQTVTANVSVTGPSFYYVDGETLTDLQILSQQETSGLTNIVESVNITLLDQGLKINNETLNINLNITNLNATIGKQYVNLQANINNIESIINGQNISVHTAINTIKQLVGIGLEEQNATFSYKLVPGTPSVTGSTFAVPVFVELMDGALANLTITQQAWQNLKLYVVNQTGTSEIPFTVVSQTPGRFVMQISLDPTQVSAIKGGSAVVSMSSPIRDGVITNVGAGIIGSQTLTSAYPGTMWYQTWLGIDTPPPFTRLGSLGEFMSDAAWFGSSVGGRAIYSIAVVLIFIVAVMDFRAHVERSGGGAQRKSRR